MPTREELERAVLEKRVMDKRHMDEAEGEATRGAEAKYEKDKPGYLESAAYGAGKGIGRNWADEAMAGVGSAMGRGNYEDLRSEYLDKERRAEAENPKTFGGAEFVGAMASAPAVTNPLGAAALAGGEGVARTLGREDKWNPGTFAQAGVTGGIDAATAGVGTKVLNKMTEFPDFIKRKAGEQAVKALGPSQRDIVKAGNKIPDIGNFVLEEKAVRPFNSSADIADRIKESGNKIGQQMNPIYDQASNQSLSRQDLTNLIEGKINEVNQEAGTVRRGPHFAGHKEDVNSAAREYYNPSDIRDYRRSFDEKIKDFSKKGDSDAMKTAKDMRWLLREQEMGLIDKADPKLRAENEDLFRKYHLQSMAQDMAERGAAKSKANNAPSLTSTILGASGFAGGAALEAGGAPPETKWILGGGLGLGRELTRRYGNQISATAMKKISNIFSNPKYSQVFEAAASRGAPAVAVTLDMILRKNPELKNEIESIISQGGEK